MRYYSKMPVGILEVTKEAYEASLTESIALSEECREDSMFKNCSKLLSLNGTHYGNEQAIIKDNDGILKKVNYFSSEGVSLLKEIIAWSESSMLSRMKEEIGTLEASLAYTQNLLAETNSRNLKYDMQVVNLQKEVAVKSFLLTIKSRKNWRNRSICEGMENGFLYLHNCVDTDSCEGCDKTFVGKVNDYL